MRETRTVRRRRWPPVLLSALLVASPLAGDGWARKKPKTFLAALVNGARLKASKRGLLGTFATTGFSIAGATKAKHGIVRTVTVTCGPVDLRSVPPATTLTGCFGSYTEAGKKTGSFRQWTGSGMELTVDAFDGGRLAGSFRGELLDPSSANPTDATATIEGGSFAMFLRDLGV